jgi:hypothetical protein
VRVSLSPLWTVSPAVVGHAKRLNQNSAKAQSRVTSPHQFVQIHAWIDFADACMAAFQPVITEIVRLPRCGH